MRIFFFLITLVFLLVTPALAEKIESTEAGGEGVTVLIYHRFGEDKYPSNNIAVDKGSSSKAFARYFWASLKRLCAVRNDA